MSKRHKENLKISEALQEFIKTNRLQSGLDKINVADAWASVMGNGVNNYTTAIKLERNTLYVQLSSSVLREELSYGRDNSKLVINDT